MQLDRTTVLEALHGVAAAISDTADPVAVASVVAREARALLRADDVVVYLLDTESGLLRLACCASDLPLRPTLKPGEAAIGRAFQTAEPVVVTDYQNWSGALPEMLDEGVKRAAAVPIRIANRCIGVLATRCTNEHGCQPAHVEVLQLLAAQVAALLDAALARQHAEVERQRLATILECQPSAVIVLDAEGRVVLLNEQARGMARSAADYTGRRPRDVLGLRVFDASSGRELAADDWPIERALRGEAVFNYEVRVRRTGADADAWVRVSAVQLPGRDGRQSGAVAVFSDVTRERTLLDSLHTSLRQNDRLVDELHAAQRRHHNLLTSLRKVDAVGEPGVLESLSARELGVLDRLALGETNREIGSALGISPGTVRKHVEHILDKLGVADRTQAAVRASELKLTIRTR